MATRDELDQAFKDTFPARSETASIEYVSIEPRNAEEFGVVMRLIVWDLDASGTRRIRDIKEQELYLKLDALDQLGRFVEMLRGMVDVLSRALARADVECLMPHDLVDFGPIRLSRSHTKDDFVRAYSQRSRLGRYL